MLNDWTIKWKMRLNADASKLCTQRKTALILHTHTDAPNHVRKYNRLIVHSPLKMLFKNLNSGQKAKGNTRNYNKNIPFPILIPTAVLGSSLQRKKKSLSGQKSHRGKVTNIFTVVFIYRETKEVGDENLKCCSESAFSCNLKCKY